MGSFLWNLLFFGIAIGILVTIHEAGHFFAARFCKVKILRFSIGFGKVLWSRKGKDGCEYAVSAIPLGGYVKMYGENKQEASELTDISGSFYAKSLGARAFIIAAGPLCNILLAFFLYVFVNLSGVTLIKPVIGDVVPDSVAAEAGFKDYDLIENIGGIETADWKNALLTLVSHSGEKNVLIEVKRDLGRGDNISLNMDLSSFKLEPDKDPLGILGLKVCVGKILNVISSVNQDSPAFRAGLKAGDEMVGHLERISYFKWDEEKKWTKQLLEDIIERAGLSESELQRFEKIFRKVEKIKIYKDGNDRGKEDEEVY